MTQTSRRTLLGNIAGGGAFFAMNTAQAQGVDIPQPLQSLRGGTDNGPRNVAIDRANPDILNPPPTDSGTLPNLKFSFSDSPNKQYSAGWTRQVTVRELGISKSIAGVNMRLNAGGTREMHWHKPAEWAFMLSGSARISAVDAQGHNFVGDVGVGDLWYFPGGVPHSIQGLGPDGCEFLLVFDDGEFDEDSTFALTDWFKHVPSKILAKNFGVAVENLEHLPDPRDRYIFNLPIPGPLAFDRIAAAVPVAQTFSHRMMAQTPAQSSGGTVRITDSSVFPASKTIAAALVEVEPGAMRELHWHPNTDEWQYYIEGQGRMGVFGGTGTARTFDFSAGDVGYVPYAMGHYIENTGDKSLRFLEVFKSSYYADISLAQWLALTPPELISGHLNFNADVMKALRAERSPVVRGS